MCKSDICFSEFVRRVTAKLFAVSARVAFPFGGSGHLVTLYSLEASNDDLAFTGSMTSLHQWNLPSLEAFNDNPSPSLDL